MSFKQSRRVSRAAKLSSFFGSASLLAITAAMPAYGQAQTAAAPATQVVPEQVIVTGSLIHGTVAVGVPVTSLGPQDYKETGALTASDLLKTVPSVMVQASLSVTQNGGNIEGAQQVEIHGIGGGATAPKTLFMLDGVRMPLQGHGNCIVDPSVIPELALDRIDVLADGASATYGSDAIAGVINVILKRGYDGATTQVRIGDSTDLGGLSTAFSQLYGRTWDGGDITLTYEVYHNAAVQGPGRPYMTYDFSHWGLDNRTPLFSGHPGVISVGDPAAPANTPPGFDPTTGTTCVNCYAVPKGQNGKGLTWAQILAANPTSTSFAQNLINPYTDSWILPDVTRNALVMTFDQDVWRPGGLVNDVSFFAEGFYNNRRNVIHSAGTTGATDVNAATYTVPTTNPFYPVGAPTDMPLEVSYNFDKEMTGAVTSGDVSGRWEGGFNLDMAYGWKGKVYYSKTVDQQFDTFYNMVNQNLANAALGNTVPASGNFGSYTKPGNVPYLNLFCDPNAFKCNDPAALAYISAERNIRENTTLDESGADFDGPLFDLPGGTVRGAIGGVYWTNHWNYADHDASNSQLGNAAPSLADDSAGQQVWAVYGQLNVPVVGDANAIPFVQALEFELSGRIDHYSGVGTTKNPKLAINWNVGAGFSIRGAAGTSFRAPLFQELSAVTGATIDPVNVVGGSNQNNEPSCPVVNVPAVKGSAAAILDPNCSPALQYLGGIAIGGGSGAAAQVRGAGGSALNPETSRNATLGFDFDPTFFKGLDINATWYDLKIKGTIQGMSILGGFDDPNARSAYILNSTPGFAQMVAATAKLPTAAPQILPGNVSFIEDLANQNLGWLAYQGIDFSASYNIDLGDWGAWDTGVTGNYQLLQQTFFVPGTPVNDFFKGQDSGGRLNYRARLGWAGGPDSAWSATLFMNYFAHGGNEAAAGPDAGTYPALPPQCFTLGQPSCASYGPQFAQYTQQFSLLSLYQPALITFDLSLGYTTGDRPANDYLKNLGVQVTINDLTNKAPDFYYRISPHHGSPQAFNINQDIGQRVVSLVVTKQW